MKTRTAKRWGEMFTLVCAWCIIITQIMAPAFNASADEYNLDAPYLNMEVVDENSYFAMLDSNGNNHIYNYSMMYEFDENDVQTLKDILTQNGQQVTGILARKYDADGNGELSITDFLSMYKQVYGTAEGFEYNNQHYPYQLVKPYQLNQDDINYITHVLSLLITDVTGVEVSYYDYNLNAKIDIGDLVAAKKFRATNPCMYLQTSYGTAIKPEDLVSLLEAADSFGVEYFMIVPIETKRIPYSIITVSDSFYELSDYKKIAPKYHSVQIVPKTDTKLQDSGLEPTYNWGKEGENGVGYWRYRYNDDDNFDGDILWIVRSSSLNGMGPSPFALIPLDENGRRLGTLYPTAKDAELAPEGVSFYDEVYDW